jgi:hypothetical protein
MVMGQQNAKGLQTLLIYIVDKLLRFIARVDNIASAMGPISYDIAIAFQTASDESGNLQNLLPPPIPFLFYNIYNRLFYNISNRLAN